jgi:hypothetical protein
MVIYESFFLLFTKLDGLPSLTVPLLVKPHHLFQVSVAERVSQVPARANQDDFSLEAVAFEPWEVLQQARVTGIKLPAEAEQAFFQD